MTLRHHTNPQPEKVTTMKRETIFISGVAATLLMLPLLLDTHGTLTSALVATVSLLAVLLITDRRINREQRENMQQPCLIDTRPREH